MRAPQDTENLMVDENDFVNVTSRRGSLTLRCIISEGLKEGVVFIPWHFGEIYGLGKGKRGNFLTHHVTDTHSKQPEYARDYE
jgi:ferredoxin-nitrate reductase